MDGHIGVVEHRHDELGRDDYLELIEIQRIAEDPAQPRQQFAVETHAALKESMRSLGRTTQHITVVSDGGAGYRVESGARRLRAARELGWTHIPAVVRSDRAAGPFDDPFTRQVADNTLRAGLRPFELCDAVDRMTSGGQPVNAICAATGLSRRTVYNYLSILEHPDLAGQLRQGRPLRPLLDEVRNRRRGPRHAAAADVVRTGLSPDTRPNQWHRTRLAKPVGRSARAAPYGTHGPTGHRRRHARQSDITDGHKDGSKAVRQPRGSELSALR